MAMKPLLTSGSSSRDRRHRHRRRRIAAVLLVCVLSVVSARSVSARLPLDNLRYMLQDIGLPPGTTATAVMPGLMSQSSTVFPTYDIQQEKIWVYRGGSYVEIWGKTRWTIGDARCWRANHHSDVCGHKIEQDYDHKAAVWLWDGPSGHVFAQLKDESEARDINDKQVVTGFAWTSNPALGKDAYIHDLKSSQTTWLGWLDLDNDGARDSGTAVLGHVINNKNVVAGVIVEGGYYDGFYWTEADGMQSLGLKNVHNVPNIHDISDTGWVAGSRGTLAFVKKIGGPYVPIATPATANGVNNDGMVVGRGGGGAYVFRNGGAYHLHALTDNLGGYTIGDPQDIDNTWTILSTATRPDGSKTLVLLNPQRGNSAVRGGSFDNLNDWTTAGGGTAETVPDPDNPGNTCVQLTTGSPVSISQSVDTPNGDFQILFDYQFLDEAGTLTVTLEQTLLATLLGADSVVGEWIDHGLVVSDPALFNLTGATLTFELDDALVGQRLLLDDVGLHLINEVPEPGTLAIMSLGALALIRRRR